MVGCLFFLCDAMNNIWARSIGLTGTALFQILRGFAAGLVLLEALFFCQNTTALVAMMMMMMMMMK